jgi:YHS domain-containing protein
MTEINDLLKRIDAEFNSSQDKLRTLRAEKSQQYADRQQRLEKFGTLLGELVPVWRPRLEALRANFGDRARVTPTITPSRRSAAFKFDTELARVNLRLSAFADVDVRQVIFSSDLEILPIMIKFDSHSEIQFPLEAVDREALAKWLDDRIVSFVRTYLSLHENPYYLRGHMVEDPVAKIQFPKFAAGATLERDGKTLYFIDEQTREEFLQHSGGGA